LSPTSNVRRLEEPETVGISWWPGTDAATLPERLQVALGELAGAAEEGPLRVETPVK